MTIETKKKFIKSQIEKLNDPHLLDAIRNLLEYAATTGYESGMKPMTRAELVRRAKISNQNIASGKTKSLKQLKKESEKW